MIKKENRRYCPAAAVMILSLCISACSSGCGSDTDNDAQILASNKNAGIILTHGTSVRIDPFIFSHRICELDKGAMVKITGKSSEKSWVGTSHLYWYKIHLENNITGWVYGRNIRIIAAENQTILKNYLSEFWEEESDKMMKEMSGKWWSVNRYGDFTSHCIELYNDGTYKSYRKGNKNIIDGVYTYDFNSKEIIFLKGTSFGKNLNYIKRGRSFILQKDLKRGELRFKRITEDISPDKEKNKNETQIK